MNARSVFFLAMLILAGLCTGCEFFSTPQERSGINPKPFNSQASWETSSGRFAN